MKPELIVCIYTVGIGVSMLFFPKTWKKFFATTSPYKWQQRDWNNAGDWSVVALGVFVIVFASILFAETLRTNH